MKFKFNAWLSLLVLLIGQIALSQTGTVSGKVSDQGGLGLPGVSVVVKGTTNGTQTDLDGNYSIQANKGATLVFSSIGLKTKEMIVSGQTLNLTLEEEVSELEDLVVTAVGIKRKPDELTTANQVIKTAELTQANNPNAIQSLAGKVSGLQINTTSTGLTPNTSIILRGPKSISGNNEALVVIDNIISSAGVLASIDPNSIESMNVIKGANGAALYGERGSNGVIIVTTKKGNKTDKLNVDIVSSVTFEEIAYLPETQDRYGQGWQGDLDWTDQGSWGPEYDGSMQIVGIPYPNSGDWRLFKYEHIEDNIKPFFNTGITYQNSISLSSGSEESGYATLNFNRQDFEGLIPEDTRVKNYINFAAGKKIGKFRLSGIARYTKDKSDRANGALYQTLSNTPGNVPVEMFSSGDNNDHWTLYDNSPYWVLKNARANSHTTISELMGEGQYFLNDNIDFILRSSVRSTALNSSAYLNSFIDLYEYTGTNRSIRSSYNRSITESTVLYTDLMANFNYDLTENLSFKSNIGLNITDSKSHGLSAGGSDLTLPLFYDLSNISNVIDANEDRFRQRTAAVFANFDLGYKNYLFLNLTGRNDWNSVLPKNKNNFFYPSAGISFIPTNAFEGLKGKILNKAKISASIVKVGNASALSAGSVNFVANQAPGYPYFLTASNSFLLETTNVDPNIENEFVTSKEFNLNLEFLNRRITLDASATFTENTNQLLNTTSSNATGFTSTLINVGKTSSKAFEVDLGFTPVKTNDIEWNNTISFSTYKTVVDKVTDDSNIVGSGAPGIYAVEGEEFPLIRGTAYTRDDEGRIVLDANGNPIRSSQLQILGKTTPDYILNFSTSFKYKNFKLSAVADYRTGHVFYSGVADQLNSQGRTIESAQNGREPFVMPNSTVQGSGTTNTSVLSGGSGSYAGYQSYVTDNYGFFDENFVLDATAFKLREVSLTYDLPTAFISKLKLNRLNIGVSGRNLLTVLPKENRGYNDPETGSGLAGYSFTPPTRFYAFSINLAF
ncbi:SusC/RagA family TonB-linked outer membrane protein [Flavobacterium sp.]|uniref:SusC/RagA family TonB-linked outer membrane protein n=1 Tax=Flavobacterium sp. TaxID=239 RepID=UPI0028BF1FD3|nr:SusC/RagA family TonB-linked outer membrane protein [Flavobacterium sp.]